MVVIRALIGALVALALAAPASSAKAPTGLVSGQVFRDATKIQCIRAPCLEPAAGVVLGFKRGTKTFRVRTDDNGRFTLSLPVGTYLVRRPVVRQGVAKSLRIAVRRDRTVRLSLRVARSGEDKPSCSGGTRTPSWTAPGVDLSAIG